VIGSGKLPYPLSPRPAPAPPVVAQDDLPHSSGGTVVIPRGWQGHFFVGGDVAGKPLHFLVDTGASSVAISRSDAAAIGIDPATLTFDKQAMTASGPIAIANVTLPRLRIGDIQLMDVTADVLNTQDGMAMLGQTFLDRIDKVSIEGDQMTLVKL
jgi:aspartyl protease family protein